MLTAAGVPYIFLNLSNHSIVSASIIGRSSKLNIGLKSFVGRARRGFSSAERFHLRAVSSMPRRVKTFRAFVSISSRPNFEFALKFERVRAICDSRRPPPNRDRRCIITNQPHSRRSPQNSFQTVRSHNADCYKKAAFSPASVSPSRVRLFDPRDAQSVVLP